MPGEVGRIEVAKIKVDIPGVRDIVNKYGLDPGGETQRFLMQTVLRRIQKYMPYQSGAMIKNMIAASPLGGDKIVVPGPYARVMYHEKVMVDSVTGKGPPVIPDVGPRWRKGTVLKASDRDINYNQEKNQQAGPYWDRRLIAAEGDTIAKEVESYAKYVAGRNHD